MPRKHFRKYLPSHESIQENRFFSRFGRFLQHPNLWHLNRRSVSGGVAVGLFAGLLPAPLQMLTAGLLSVPLRVNLPVAILMTLYTNPFTIVPIYWAAYEIGSLFITGPGNMTPPPAFSFAELGAWLGSVWKWAMYYGKPLALGLLVLGAALALVGYIAVYYGWGEWVRMTWRRRKKKRAARIQVS